MEHRQREGPLAHALDELGDGVLVVVSGERGREPEPERPGGDPGRPAGQRGVSAQHVFRRGAGDHVVVQGLPRHRELHPGVDFRADLERHAIRAVHQHPVAAAGEIERHRLVRLLAGGAAISVPGIDDLAVLHERAEPFTESVDALAGLDRELLMHPRPLRAPVMCPTERGNDVVSTRSASSKVDLPRAAASNPHSQSAGVEDGLVIVDLEGGARSRPSPRSRSAGPRSTLPAWRWTRTLITPGAGAENATVSIARLSVSPRWRTTAVGAYTVIVPASSSTRTSSTSAAYSGANPGLVSQYPSVNFTSVAFR